MSTTTTAADVVGQIVDGAQRFGTAVAPIVQGAIDQAQDIAETPQAQALWAKALEFGYNNKLTVCLPVADAVAGYFLPHLFHNKYAYIGAAVAGQLADHWDVYGYYLGKAYTGIANVGCAVVPSLPWCETLAIAMETEAPAAAVGGVHGQEL
jgi:hypothetical protein